MSMESKQKRTPSYLPHDVIEIILFRLPVKSLLRFKAACKQWSATISDPIFAHSHLQQSKTASCCSYLQPAIDALRRVVLENHEFRELFPFEYPAAVTQSSKYRFWCHCDGLFLIAFYTDRANFVLWNPSRRTSRQLHYPYPLSSDCRQRIGICYNPLVKDYRVVIVDAELYAVFSCRNNSWSEMRSHAISFDNFEFPVKRCVGVAYNESIYWVLHSTSHDLPRSQIICFDGRDEKLKIFRDCADHHALFTSGDGLYIVPICKTIDQTPADMMKTELVIKKILPAWMELEEVQLPFSRVLVEPLCLTQQRQILFGFHFTQRTRYLLYDYGERCFADIQPSSNFMRPAYFGLFPYIENLFPL